MAWIALASAGVLLAALVVCLVLLVRARRQADDRLWGTWQSDADRTIAGIRERRPVDEKQEAALRRLFGKLKITYTATTLTTELNGVTESNPYEVLGRDQHSVVIRELGPKPQGLEDLSEFTVIYFEGPDVYWLHTQLGGVREYFKRIGP